jgi:glycosyltransferase involved in cell wall biosynthesis
MRSIGCEAEVQPFIEYQKSIPGSFDAKMELVRAAERYSDLILSQPDMAQLLSRPYMRVNLPIDLSQYRFNVTEREVPLVLHIPSNRDVKGTVHVLAAVQELAHKKLRFEFRLIENMPNDDVRNLLSDADIVVDALFMQTFGMLAIEALATGKSVLARYDARFSLFPPECPVINVNINNLTDRLGRVISDRGLRRRVGHEGRAYVEKHHSHVRVTQQIIDLLGSEHIRVYDFYPSFFKKNLVVPPELLEQERIREKRLKKTGRKLPLRIRRCVLWPLVLYHRE